MPAFRAGPDRFGYRFVGHTRGSGLRLSGHSLLDHLSDFISGPRNPTFKFSFGGRSEILIWLLRQLPPYWTQVREGVNILKVARRYTKRSLVQVLEGRKDHEKKLVELTGPAAEAVATKYSVIYGLECFQTTDVFNWLTDNSYEYSCLPYLGRSALVEAIRQNGWRTKTLRPVYGHAMHVWVKEERVGDTGESAPENSGDGSTTPSTQRTVEGPDLRSPSGTDSNSFRK